jgi:RimJ/RimL family protein N-acetyltransferase
MRIETDRLLLRPLELQDVEALVALHATPEVSRFMTVLNREQATRRVNQDRRDWAERGYGMVAIVDRATGRFLGRSGLRAWPQFGEVEVGWALRPASWGRGVATEAGRACVQTAFERCDLRYVTAMIREDNVRSRRVAERLGMAPLRRDVLGGQEVIVYALRREEWARSEEG